MKKQLLSAIFVFVLAAPGCKDQAAWVRKMGFTPLNPPSQLLSPGAVIMRRNQFGKIKLLCSAEESLGADFRPTKSRTIGGKYRRGSKIGWRIKGDALKQIQLAANSQDIREIFVQVENARIASLADTDVLLAASNRSPACRSAIARRVAEGWDISIISQSLTADVSYSVQFSSEAEGDLDARLAQLQAVSVTLGGSFKATSDQSASAKNLVYGLKDDRFLAGINPDDADVRQLRGQAPITSKRQSLLMSQESLITDAEAPSGQAAEPSWGVTTADEAADPVPGFDDALKDAEADAPPGQGLAQPQPEEEVEAMPQDPAHPISPRSRHRQ